jgi:PKD repeat protein
MWNFGDGTTSNEQNPSHTYTKTGSYTISLTVAGPGGTHTKTVAGFIQATTPPPVANFTTTQRTGNKPLNVKFTDTSTGDITSRLWNFGDGSTSTELNPSHTYNKVGSFTVSLTVTGPGGSNTKTVEGFIQVTTPPPVADFTSTPRGGSPPLLVQFTDASTGDITNHLWDFGDGTTSKEQNPSHTYVKEGSYTVSLTVSGPGGSDTKTAEGYIEAKTAPAKANLTLSKRLLYRRWFIVTADIILTDNDSIGAPLKNATVKGHWGADYNGTVTGVTNENGYVTFRLEWVAQRSTISFTIDKVIIDGKEYDFAGKKTESIGT